MMTDLIGDIPMLGLGGKKVLVIGGTGGVGSVLCELLQSNGATVVSTSRNPDKCNLVLDLAEASSVDGFINSMMKETPFDAVIVNAADNFPSPIWEIQDEKLSHLVEVNTLAPIRIMRALSGHMKEAKAGKIVFITSIASISPRINSSVYAASKGAINAFMRSAAMDLAPFNILVNAVLPGPIKTNMTKSVLTPQQIEHIDNAIPINRMAEPKEIANAILFLISDMNSYITGQSLVIDGGLTIQQVN